MKLKPIIETDYEGIFPRWLRNPYNWKHRVEALRAQLLTRIDRRIERGERIGITLRRKEDKILFQIETCLKTNTCPKQDTVLFDRLKEKRNLQIKSYSEKWGKLHIREKGNKIMLPLNRSAREEARAIGIIAFQASSGKLIRAVKEYKGTKKE